jgi:hypothetical protein
MTLGENWVKLRAMIGRGMAGATTKMFERPFRLFLIQSSVAHNSMSTRLTKKLHLPIATFVKIFNRRGKFHRHFSFLCHHTTLTIFLVKHPFPYLNGGYVHIVEGNVFFTRNLMRKIYGWISAVLQP